MVFTCFCRFHCYKINLIHLYLRFIRKFEGFFFCLNPLSVILCNCYAILIKCSHQNMLLPFNSNLAKFICFSRRKKKRMETCISPCLVLKSGLKIFVTLQFVFIFVLQQLCFSFISVYAKCVPEVGASRTHFLELVVT